MRSTLASMLWVDASIECMDVSTLGVTLIVKWTL